MTTRVTVTVATDAPLSVPFPYLSRSHVYVELNGTPTTDFEWVTESTIDVTDATNGDEVTIYRSTQLAPMTEYQTGPVLTKAELEIDSLQALYLAEELSDEIERQAEIAAASDAALDADIDALDTRVDALEAAVADLVAPSVPQLAGYAYDANVAVDEGKVLTFSKSSDPDDDGTLGASYMPAPFTYSPGAMFGAFPLSYATPSVHIHNGAGTLQVLISEDDWPIGVVHDFWQVGNGRITVEISSGGTNAASVYLDAYTADRTHIDTYNGVYTPAIRSAGVGARFSIVRASTHIFMCVGAVEDVP